MQGALSAIAARKRAFFAKTAAAFAVRVGRKAVFPQLRPAGRGIQIHQVLIQVQVRDRYGHFGGVFACIGPVDGPVRALLIAAASTPGPNRRLSSGSWNRGHRKRRKEERK